MDIYIASSSTLWILDYEASSHMKNIQNKFDSASIK